MARIDHHLNISLKTKSEDSLFKNSQIFKHVPDTMPTLGPPGPKVGRGGALMSTGGPNVGRGGALKSARGTMSPFVYKLQFKNSQSTGIISDLWNIYQKR